MKRIYSLLCAAAVGLSGIAVCVPPELTVFAAEEAPTSGECGDSLTWEFDAESGTLTISGSGEMDNWGYASEETDDIQSPPWHFKSDIKKIVLEDGVTSIGDYAFYDCSNATEIIIPEGVVKIGDRAIEGCENLETVTLPEGLTTIGAYAFSGCTKLENLNIPESVNVIGSCAFGYTAWINNLWEENPWVIINHILLGPGNGTTGDVVIPDDVTEIISGAFYGASDITSVKLPFGIKTIPSYAFSYTSITEIEIPENVTKIEDNAFRDSMQLQTVTILNPDCEIEGFPFNPYGFAIREWMNGMTLRGYDNSTAQAFAELVNTITAEAAWGEDAGGCHFESLGAAPGENEPETGDLDGDGEIGVTDAQLALNAYVQGITGAESGLTDAQIKAADVDGDGQLTVTDAQLILNYYVQNTVLGADKGWDELTS